MKGTWWNYRVLEEDSPFEDGEKIYTIIEVYYNDDNTIFAWTEASPMGHNILELKGDLSFMREGTTHAPLRPEHLPGTTRHNVIDNDV